MGRKHNVPIEALPALAQKFAADLSALAAGRSEIGRLEGEVNGPTRPIAPQRPRSALRASEARAAGEAVSAELAPLKLERAEFSVDLKRDETIVAPSGSTARSSSSHQSRLAARPADEGGVGRRAGEVSASDQGPPGRARHRANPRVRRDRHWRRGRRRDAMGQRLARLSARAQVLAVTHAPQVAARAQNHYRIVKSDVGAGERVATRVSRLEAIERREEIARMLAGAEITREAGPRRRA